MVLLLMYLEVEGIQAFSGLLPTNTLFPVYLLFVRFIVRKISAVAAIACSVHLISLGKEEALLTLKGECASLASSCSSLAWQATLWQLILESLIKNLFRETLRLLFVVIAVVP